MLNLPNTIKMVITDFDGIITDNCVYIDSKGEMTRKLNFKVVMAFSILQKKGYKIAIISGEGNSAIKVLDEKFNLDEVYENIRIKIDVLKSIIDKYNLKSDEYLYIGDDINDIEALEFAQYKITVPDAVKRVKDIPNIQQTTQRGGDGAFREVVDCLTNS